MSALPCAKEYQKMVDAKLALDAAQRVFSAFASTEPFGKVKDAGLLEMRMMQEAREREKAAQKDYDEKKLAYAECRKRRGL